MPVTSAVVRGWVFYDASCRFCVRSMRRWGGFFARRGYVWLPLQTPGTAARLGIAEDRLGEEMWLQVADGGVLAGSAAWSHLLRSVWWLWPVGWGLNLPGFRSFARLIYRWIARNRHCLGGVCRVYPPDRPAPHRHAAFFEIP